MTLLQQNQTASNLVFLLIDSADHIAGKTGASPTVTLSKNGAAFGACAGAVTEISAGWYKVAGNATDTNTLGPLALHATASGADPSDSLYQVVGFDPNSTLGGSGLSGPSSVTLTFEDSNEDAVPFVDFTIVGQGYGRANASGVSAFGLADGSYTVVGRPTNGVVFSNSALTVSGTTTLTITGTTPVITPPADPSLCLLYGYLVTLDDQPAVGVRIRITLVSSAPATSGSIVTQSPPVFATTTSAGYFEIELQRNDLMTPDTTQYLVECDQINMKKRVTLEAATQDLGALIT